MATSNPRLYPSKSGGRYFILTKLRQCNEYVIEKYLTHQSQKLTILDYGCGNTPYKPMFEPHVDRYIGADLPLNPSAEVHLNPDGTLPTPSDSIDIILSTQVLEHVTDVQLYLEECQRVLKPEGLLILSTHGHWKYHPDPTDYWRWTRDGLQKTVEKSGLQVAEIMGIMGLAASGLQLFQDGVMPKVHPRLLRLFFYFIQFVQGKVDTHHLHQVDASVFVVVAKKYTNDEKKQQ